MRNFNPTTIAFSPERVRASMLENLQIPKEIVNKAIAKLDAQLSAKQTKFFAHQGEVIDKVNVEDHAIQQSAADKILTMAGLYVDKRDSKPNTPTIVIETDPQTGIVRMIIGGASALPSLEDHTDNASLTSPVSTDAVVGPLALSEVLSEEPEIIKVRRGGLTAEVHDALFGKD